ncbi:MAG: hypothetical protein ACLT4D_14415 [Blautia faecis]
MTRYTGNVPDGSGKRYAEERAELQEGCGDQSREKDHTGAKEVENRAIQKKKKQSWGMYLIGGAASGYGGYLLNVCYQPERISIIF